MSFIENINSCISGQFGEPVYRAVLLGDDAGYFENVKQIISYDKEEIVLALKQGGLKISGRDLYIKKYCAGDVVICGKIACLQRIL